jgi:hypothetical protein
MLHTQHGSDHHQSTPVIHPWMASRDSSFTICNITRGVSHIVARLAIYIKKKYLKAKEELCKLKYFTMQKYT